MSRTNCVPRKKNSRISRSRFKFASVNPWSPCAAANYKSTAFGQALDFTAGASTCDKISGRPVGMCWILSSICLHRLARDGFPPPRKTHVFRKIGSVLHCGLRVLRESALNFSVMC
eukprot:3070830-Amphidinium_carterae.1